MGGGGGELSPRPSQRCSARRGWASAASGSVSFSAPERGEAPTRQAWTRGEGPQGTRGNSCGRGRPGCGPHSPPRGPLRCMAREPVRSLETRRVRAEGQGRGGWSVARGVRRSHHCPLVLVCGRTGVFPRVSPAGSLALWPSHLARTAAGLASPSLPRSWWFLRPVVSLAGDGCHSPKCPLSPPKRGISPPTGTQVPCQQSPLPQAPPRLQPRACADPRERAGHSPLQPSRVMKQGCLREGGRGWISS